MTKYALLILLFSLNVFAAPSGDAEARRWELLDAVHTGNHDYVVRNLAHLTKWNLYEAAAVAAEVRNQQILNELVGRGVQLGTLVVFVRFLWIRNGGTVATLPRNFQRTIDYIQAPQRVDT